MSIFPMYREGFTTFGTGKDMDAPMKVCDLAIPDLYRPRHIFVFGSTGVGKTVLGTSIMEQDIIAGRSVIFMDPKIDQEAAAKIVQTAAGCGRRDDVMFVNTAFPELSAVINPLSHWFIPEELVGHCVAGIKEGKDPFFRNSAKEITGAVIAALNCLARAEGKSRAELNFAEIKKYISRDGLMQLYQGLSCITTPEADSIASDLQQIINTGEEYYTKVASSLRVAFNELTTGNIGKIIGTVEDNLFLRRLEEGKRVILVCQLGSQIVQEAAYTLGKVILSMIQSFVGRNYCSKRRKVDPPLCLHIDEAQDVIFNGIERMYAQGGSGGLWITSYAQSVNQVFAILGEFFGKTILDNTNTKAFMRVPDAETAAYVTAHFGTHRIQSPIVSYNGITAREVEEDVIKPFDVISLLPREFYMLTYADGNTRGRYKGRTHDASRRWVEIEYPDAPAH